MLNITLANKKYFFFLNKNKSNNFWLTTGPNSKSSFGFFLVHQILKIKEDTGILYPINGNRISATVTEVVSVFTYQTD